jgi:raffinose/stachyose/melibiose transport system substrate-binding protein
MSKAARIVSIIVSVVITLSLLSACGAVKAPDTTAQQSSIQPTKPAESTTAATPVEQKTLIFYTEAMEGQPGGDAIRARAKQFEQENPGLKVEFRSAAGQDFDKFFKTAVSGNEQIDAVEVNVQFFRDYVTKNFLLDLTDKIDKVKTPVYDMAWDQLKYFAMDNKIYGIPTMLNTCGIYYNKAIFKKYNLEIPKTWDDIYKMKDVLKKDGVYPLVYAGAEPWWNPMHFNMIFYQMTNNQGIQVNDKFMHGDFSKETIQPYVDTIQFLANLDKNKVFIPGTQGMDSPAATTAFTKGKAAMYFMGSWYIGNLKQADPSFDYGVFPVPLIKDGVKSEAPGSINSIMSVYSKSQNADDAYKFVQYVCSVDFAKDYSKNIGDAVNVYQGAEGVNPNPVMADLEKIAPSTVIWLDAIWEPEIITDFQQGIQAAILGKKTPQQVMDGIVDHYKKLREQGKTFYK